MSGEWTRLNGVQNIGDSLTIDQLSANMVEFLSWGFLNIGAFFNVNRPGSSGHYGGDQFRLRAVKDPYYNTGQVWEGFRLNWVWESGIEYAYQPIPISGIYLNNTFLPLQTSGTYSYHINYPLGRVTFDNPIPVNSRVELNYSYKNVNVYTSDAPGFKELQFNSFLIEGNFNNASSGVRSVLGQSRIQLPAVIVEVGPQRDLRPYQMGGGQIVTQDVLFHIFAETSSDRGKLVDILTYQKEKRIMFFDQDAILSANAFPLDEYQSLRPGALCYPDLLKTYPGNHVRDAHFADTRGQEMGGMTPGLFTGIVRAKIEMQIGPI